MNNMNYNTEDTIILIIAGSETKVLAELGKVVYDLSGFVVIPGSQNHTAVIYDPPAFPEEETGVMKELSSRISGEHFSAWTYPSENNVHTYIGGKLTESRHVELNAFLLNLGLNILPAKVILDRVIWSALIVPESTASHKAISTLLTKTLEKEILNELVIANHQEGTAIYHTSGDISIILFTLVDEYAGNTTSIYWKSNDEFMVQFDNPEEEPQIFIHPLPTDEELDEDSELLTEIGGKNNPLDIVNDLGLDPRLLPTALKKNAS
jgi:hypothetical protein